MDCPGCNVEMSTLEGEDQTLQKCVDCGGLWIDVADLNRVLLHHNLPGLESLGGKLNAEALTGQCPACQVDLVSVDGGEVKVRIKDGALAFEMIPAPPKPAKGKAMPPPKAKKPARKKTSGEAPAAE